MGSFRAFVTPGSEAAVRAAGWLRARRQSLRRALRRRSRSTSQGGSVGVAGAQGSFHLGTRENIAAPPPYHVVRDYDSHAQHAQDAHCEPLRVRLFFAPLGSHDQLGAVACSSVAHRRAPLWSQPVCCALKRLASSYSASLCVRPGHVLDYTCT